MAKERKRLGDLLTEAKLVTRNQIDQALQAQIIFGGRLGTNLIEMGAIDHEATGEGVIVCEDGFRSGFMRADEFRELWSRLGLESVITTVDDSVTFCESVVG